MTETWKLEKDLCRCCHSEGSYKSLALPWMTFGVEEVYADMLMECYNIAVAPVNGPLHDITFAICEPCIQRLRDATFFKKQVLDCEQKFKRMYANNVLEAHNKVEVKKEPVIFLDDMEDDDDEQIDYDDDFANDKVFQRIKNEVEDIDESEVKIRKKIKGKGKAKPKKKITKKKKGTESSPKTNLLEDRLKSVPPTPKFRLRSPEDYKELDVGYQCVRCEKQYNKWLSLRFHVKYVHYKMPRFVCPSCGEKFMTLAPFTKHKLEKHSIDDRYQCTACEGWFNTKIQLKKHVNTFHMMGEKHECGLCDYVSFSVEAMYKHKFKHKTVKDFHCKFCKKSFLRKATLDLHERIHTGDRRKVCKECGQAFVQKASLNYHMTKYHPEVNF